jgi:hypothetical protein
MELKEIDKKIEKIKNEIQKIDLMRPGSLSRQYNVCGVEKCRCKDELRPKKHGPYLNLNYVHQGKKKTQFIRNPFAKSIERQLRQYKKFRDLSQQWITLAIERSNLEMKLEIEKTVKK